MSTWRFDPMRFDIVIVPFHTDQVFLGERREELEAFVNDGGILLVLGACDLAGSNWIPFCTWTRDYTTATTVAKSSTAQAVFKGVDLKIKRNVPHTHWHAHGALLEARPELTETLAMGEDDRIVMLLVKTRAGGAAIVTTLDPDHHSSPAVPGGKLKNTQAARKTSHRLLHNLLNLAKRLVKARQKSSTLRLPEARTMPPVFLVHGRNIDVRDKLNLYLTNELGLDVSVMEFGAHSGRTLPEKFEEIAQMSGFAVFLMTAEDQCRTPDGKTAWRARQNVVLEIGYFWGALGRRGRVAFLVEENLELPSDIQGIGWIPITADLAATKRKLRKELEDAGFVRPTVSPN
ncbi:MAG: nucleotide-binding protein [Candidatus Eisenbacteria bacterium]